MNDLALSAPVRGFSVQPSAWPTYPEYKDSGAEWLDKIPVGWSGTALKRWVDVKITDTGKLALVDVDFEFSVWSPLALIRANLEKIIPQFLFLALHADYIQNQIQRTWSAGTQPNISMAAIERLYLIAPPLPEQCAIVNFLNYETTKIDALIAKKERLIELLQEKRAALTSHAVTKGLASNVAMKDSGVEWLGEILAHWEARQLKYVAEISYGLTLELDRTETKGTRIISLPNVTKEGQLVLDDVPVTPLMEQEKKELLLRKGDLLFNWRNGSPDHVGKTAYFDADGEYTHVSFLLRLRFDPTRQESRYYQMFLNGLRSNGFFSAAKTRVNKTYNQTELGRLKVVVPPLEEQSAIAIYLNQETAKIDTLITKTQETIEKLKEYRTALISATVTGKIDVRETISTKGDDHGQTS